MPKERCVTVWQFFAVLSVREGENWQKVVRKTDKMAGWSVLNCINWLIFAVSKERGLVISY